MTFIGEIEGKATKVKATNFFATLKVSSDVIKEESDEESGDEEK